MNDASAFWDGQYASEAFKYGTAPNAFLAGQADKCWPKPARLLVPADGEGRNGAWLAAQGHKVWVVEQSARGIEKARQLATRKGAEVLARMHWQQADLTRWTPPSQPFDGVVLCFVHLDGPSWHAALQRCWQALKPGGLLLMESFHVDQLGRPSGGPKDAALLYTLDGLRQSVSDLGLDAEEWLAETCATVLDEGPGHQGEARVVRWGLRKPDTQLTIR